MSLTANPLPLDDDFAATAGPDASDDAMVREERSPIQGLFFIPALICSGVSMIADGVPLLTDAAWLITTVLCIVFLFQEFRTFSYRWGIGGFLLYGGSLVWMSYDYMTTWFGQSFVNNPDLTGMSAEVVARATFASILWITAASFGLRLFLRGKVEGVLAKVPEPGDGRLYLGLAIIMFLVGMSPYFFFTVGNPFSEIFDDMVGGRGGGARWTVGRDGNVNYSFGAYLAQVLQIGTFGGLLASFYAIMIARSWIGRIIAFMLWFPVTAIAFGSGTRGTTVALILPVVGFLFLRLQAQAALNNKRVSLRAYLWLAFMMAVILAVVQIQITFRGGGFRNADISEAANTKIQGNSMFSESLIGFDAIPKYRAPFYDIFPGSTILLPIPESLFWFVVSPMPRAIWTSKPIDPAWAWYNKLVAGADIQGTTISNGTAGHWYFRFGLWGVLQGGLFMGFLMGVSERLLRNFGHKPICILVSLVLALFIFRCYRGLAWHELHASIVGIVFFSVAAWTLKNLFGFGTQSDPDAAPDQSA